MNAATEFDHSYLSLLDAANTTEKVSGLTHGFYRYPARFGQTFVRAAIAGFSKENDIIFDPFCGGGTTVVEALAEGRRAIGSDLSELAIFVSQVKTSALSQAQLKKMGRWVESVIEEIGSRQASHQNSFDPRLDGLPDEYRQVIALICDRISNLPRGEMRRFASCIVMKAAQWALDGKERLPDASHMVARLSQSFTEMRQGMEQFVQRLAENGMAYR